MRSHVVITGTGRAGTTFLIHLLTCLGLDTGYDAGAIELPLLSRAGLELDIRAPTAPYIIKNPHICDQAEEILASDEIRLEHAIIPVRNFDAAAASRAHVQKLTTGSADGKTVHGGLWATDRADEQVNVLRRKFTSLIETLVRYDVPMTFLSYPRLVQDPQYLYGKLQFLLSEIDPATFRKTFDAIVHPEWVHQFNGDDRVV